MLIRLLNSQEKISVSIVFVYDNF
jgi:hypothetical protein